MRPAGAWHCKAGGGQGRRGRAGSQPEACRVTALCMPAWVITLGRRPGPSRQRGLGPGLGLGQRPVAGLRPGPPATCSARPGACPRPRTRTPHGPGPDSVLIELSWYDLLLQTQETRVRRNPALGKQLSRARFRRGFPRTTVPTPSTPPDVNLRYQEALDWRTANGQKEDAASPFVCTT